MEIFSEYNLAPEDKKKGRKILRRLASREYFGDVSTLLVRIVAENMNSCNLVYEAEKMIQWCKDSTKGRRKKARPSVLRFNNWIVRVRQNNHTKVSSDLEKDLEKVERFKKKYGVHKQ